MKCTKRKTRRKVAADGGQERTCSLKLKRAKCCFFFESQKIALQTLPETELKSRVWTRVRELLGPSSPGGGGWTRGC